MSARQHVDLDVVGDVVGDLDGTTTFTSMSEVV
jgi:hypothetical protein